jgi:hypothetical protein
LQATGRRDATCDRFPLIGCAPEGFFRLAAAGPLARWPRIRQHGKDVPWSCARIGTPCVEVTIMSIWKLAVPWVVGVVLATSLSATAAEDKPAAKKAAEKPAAAPPSAQQIAALVKQLDSDKFADRQAASDRLSEIGKPAIGALAEAAAGDSLEVTVRSIDILKKLLESSDEATKGAAKAALEKVAASKRPAAARRAQDALKALEQQRSAQRFMPGGIQIAVVGGARRMSVRNTNGVKTIEAEEANRKVKIVDDPKQGIKMEVTTKNDKGKESTEKYEAKTAEELKKKHPKAYEIYNKYSKQGGAFNFNVQMRVGGAAPIRVQPRPRRVNSIDTAARILPAWAAHLKRLASDEAIKGASKESNETLRKKVAEVRKQLEDLDKRLQKAIEASEKEKKEQKKDE